MGEVGTVWNLYSMIERFQRDERVMKSEGNISPAHLCSACDIEFKNEEWNEYIKQQFEDALTLDSLTHDTIPDKSKSQKPKQNPTSLHFHITANAGCSARSSLSEFLQ